MTQPLLLHPTTEGRVADDFYPTPKPNTRQILDVLGFDLMRGLVALDPGCGDGAILDVCAERGATTMGIELDPMRAAKSQLAGHHVTAGDALAVPWPDCDILAGNPPFKLALEFAQRAAEWARVNRAPAVLLLRLAFLETQARYQFHQDHPSDVYVLSKRPSFRTDRGSATDLAAYAWFAFGPGRGGRVKVLPAVTR